MIDKKVYEIEYIRNLQKKFSSDPGLIERAIYAFGLLEAIASVGMPFCFKGGTSLMLILDKPARLSTDIDVIVEPGTDVDGYIEKASSIFPFVDKFEDIRKGRNGIVKRHFKFTYHSPVRNKEFYILLDVVFSRIPYAKTMRKEIKNDLLLTTENNLFVEMPTADCILGDKLTAFAPHTTGILLGTGRELEIAKQLFDTSTLTDYISDFNLLTETYANSALEETEFRGGSWSRDDILKDTIRACKSIISRGAFDGDDYLEYLRGIKSLGNHILLKGYNTDDATWRACKVIYLASCLLSGNPYRKIESPEEYLTARLQGNDFKKLSYIKKQNAESYAYLVEATRNLK
ncbi:MAG: nucleotidyl transferase AbiEii/AbiGii toxin family protein [Clostridia bacterium]|nr:nucleotidyl transferase AbiEii/AbiGii toxin family protein [Clostridia bacterium]MBP5781657.1 nucleotidyl transferase AbiEii/AbiGii toxin family protein [Clostridia bacterium]